MSSILKHWREASTLLLIIKSRIPVVSTLQSANYEVLMLKRSGKSKFMPSMHVFPGGMSDDADFSPDWMEMFNETGPNVVENMLKSFCRGGEGPPMFSRKRDPKFSKTPSELAFRICAIRETFEESGILLARDVNLVRNEKMEETKQPLSGKSSVLSENILMPWRKRVDKNASEFISMCKELQIVPDVWSLQEWSNWLTPVMHGVKKPIERTSGRRYDTAFFLSVLDYKPVAAHDDNETTELEWSSPGQLLEKHFNKEIPLQLAPPQIVELARLLNFSDADKLKQFSWDRATQRVLHLFPISCKCDNGFLFLYPGDELYPEEPDYEGANPMLELEGTVEELRTKYPRYYRTEMFSDESGHMQRTIICNVEMLDGQVSPKVDPSLLSTAKL